MKVLFWRTHMKSCSRKFHNDAGKSMFTVKNNNNRTRIKIEIKGNRKSSLTPFLSPYFCPFLTSLTSLAQLLSFSHIFRMTIWQVSFNILFSIYCGKQLLLPETYKEYQKNKIGGGWFYQSHRQRLNLYICWFLQNSQCFRNSYFSEQCWTATSYWIWKEIRMRDKNCEYERIAFEQWTNLIGHSFNQVIGLNRHGMSTKLQCLSFFQIMIFHKIF